YLSGTTFNSLRTSVSSSIVCPRLAALFTKVVSFVVKGIPYGFRGFVFCDLKQLFFCLLEAFWSFSFSGSYNRKDRVTLDSSRSYASLVVVFSNHWDSLDLLCELGFRKLGILKNGLRFGAFLITRID
nr:hypothetical protein [Tanacetum cinerariifolium]